MAHRALLGPGHHPTPSGVPGRGSRLSTCQGLLLAHHTHHHWLSAEALLTAPEGTDSGQEGNLCSWLGRGTALCTETGLLEVRQSGDPSPWAPGFGWRKGERLGCRGRPGGPDANLAQPPQCPLPGPAAPARSRRHSLSPRVTGRVLAQSWSSCWHEPGATAVSCHSPKTHRGQLGDAPRELKFLGRAAPTRVGRRKRPEPETGAGLGLRTDGLSFHRTKTILVPQSCIWLPASATPRWWTGCCVTAVRTPPQPQTREPCLSTTLPPKETSPP